MWWCIPVIPALRRWNLEDQAFRVILGYIASCRPAWDPVFFKKKMVWEKKQYPGADDRTVQNSGHRGLDVQSRAGRAVLGGLDPGTLEEQQGSGVGRGERLAFLGCMAALLPRCEVVCGLWYVLEDVGLCCPETLARHLYEPTCGLAFL